MRRNLLIALVIGIAGGGLMPAAAYAQAMRRLASAALRRFWKDNRGSTSLISIMAAIPVVAAAGMGIDYSRTVRAKTEIQEVADAAALAAASGKNITGPASAKQVQRQNIASKFITDSLAKVSDVEIIGSPQIIAGPNTVDVSINARVKGTFLNVLNALPDDALIDPNSNGDGQAGDKSYDFDFNIQLTFHGSPKFLIYPFDIILRT